MAILKEYRCKAHGDFEAFDDGKVKCPAPKCRFAVTQVFLTPPGIISRATRVKDGVWQDIANGFNATDMSNKDGVFKMNQKTKNASGIVRDDQGRILPASTYGITPKVTVVEDPKTGKKVKRFNPGELGVGGGTSPEGLASPLKNVDKYLYLKPSPDDLKAPT